MEPQMRTDPSRRKLRSYSGMVNTWRKRTLQLPTSDGRLSSSDIRGLPITTWKLTGLARVSPCLDALLCRGRSNGGVVEDDGPEPRDAIYAVFIPPEWAEHHIRATDTPSQQLAQEAQKAEVSWPLETWCRPNTTASETSSLRKPLMNSHHGRYGTTPLTSHLALNSLTPRCSPCPLQNRRSLMTSSGRTLRMAASVHLSPPWEPLCSLSKRRMAHFALCRTIRS